MRLTDEEDITKKVDHRSSNKHIEWTSNILHSETSGLCASDDGGCWHSKGSNSYIFHCGRKHSRADGIVANDSLQEWSGKNK
mmetsp:Transcript_72885/g.211011  ORF Transcript_72885/g.211011 Transcript_72885/m.211011 type:complete len:82 (+) Transcript_72885:1178-1423(+)